MEKKNKNEISEKNKVKTDDSEIIKPYKSSMKLIKSIYNIKQVLSYLSEKIKLNMIIYNKVFQNKLGINIENYKKISGKYKIGVKNGKGKEYDISSYTLLFEGEYLNGRRNGKGKEYSNKSYLKFEGEYLNGRRNGKGKEYFNKRKLKFEGEYLKGKKWNGKGYDIQGNIKYEIKNGNGFFQDYDDDGRLKFEGYYLNGEISGKGKEFYDYNKLKFEGEYLKGKRNGKGK